ncbi:hypothetical protein [Frigoribacterium sp. PhB24]|uniref:hypothetical protein n=1 Tax=Frigoribacterium sp. PhB24 TaxID=2485204 RepID=UPI000F49A44D|nr:hypothetical protein [Frigoribacterium sp. PhB24]ROS49523.1 hypothetical protein EDF50_2438 [Frigoribacterium sp. PhB24]
MPFDQWYDDATREAATARVLQRKMTNPTDRNVLTVVAEEFNVPRQTLSDWVDQVSPGSAKPPRKPRPKFSQVVKTTKEARVESPTDEDADEVPPPAAPPEPASEFGPEAAPQTEPEREPDPERGPWSPADPAPEPEPTPEPEPEPEPQTSSVPAPADDRLSALEAEVAALRADNRALVEALRVLVDD